MFLGFLTAQKPVYEDRVDYETELPKLHNLWQEMQNRCFDRYLDTVNDDAKGMHVYQVLNHEVSTCKQMLDHENRREVLQRCHQKIVSLAKRCQAKPEDKQRPE